MEISNKTLTWLVVVAIAVSVLATGGVLMQLSNIKGATGFAAGDTYNVSGQADVTISSQTTLRFSTSSLNFGTLSVNTTITYCNITINGSAGAVVNVSFLSAGCDNQTGQPLNALPLTLENAGSTYLNVSLNFSAAGATFSAGSLIGGAGVLAASPFVWFNVNNNETGSCTQRFNYNATTWTNLTLSNTNTPLITCENLSYTDATDSLIIGLKLGLPIDASSAPKTIIIRAQGTALN